MNTTQRLAAMEAIFAQFPAIECKKLCSDFCNIIPMSRLEFARLQKRAFNYPRLGKST